MSSWSYIDIEKLVKADWNYKDDDDYLKEKLKENIKKNGQIENIVVRELDDGKFEIVNGNHRYDALKELGYKEVYVYNLGKISEKKAKRIAIELNETFFKSNIFKLSETIKDIVDEFGLDDVSKSLPFSDEELNSFLSKIEPFNPQDEDSDFSNSSELDDDFKIFLEIEFNFDENEKAKQLHDELKNRGYKVNFC